MPKSLGTPVFTHNTYAKRRYAPHDLAMTSNSKIKRVTKMGIKKTLFTFLNEHVFVSQGKTKNFLLFLSYPCFSGGTL